MSLYPGEYISHRDDLISDYIFFGEAFRWEPDAINRLGWSFRKELKEVFIEVKRKEAEQYRTKK